MKKLFGTLVAVGAMVLMAVGVQAATYSAGIASPEAGIAEVPVLVTPAENETESVNGYVVTFTYDSTKVTPVVAGTDATGADCYAEVGADFAEENSVLVSDIVATEGNNQTLAVAWAGADAITVDKQTQLANVDFEVAEGTTGDVPVTVQVVALTKDGTSEATDYVAADGEIMIDTEVVLGDVTGNGIVNMDDVTLLTQYVNMVYDRDSILNAYPQSNVDAGNVSGKDNDTINMDDVTVLTQYVNMVFDSLEDIQ